MGLENAVPGVVRGLRADQGWEYLTPSALMVLRCPVTVVGEPYLRAVAFSPGKSDWFSLILTSSISPE